jgi:hypothetical protein
MQWEFYIWKHYSQQGTSNHISMPFTNRTNILGRSRYWNFGENHFLDFQGGTEILSWSKADLAIHFMSVWILLCKGNHKSADSFHYIDYLTRDIWIDSIVLAPALVMLHSLLIGKYTKSWCGHDWTYSIAITNTVLSSWTLFHVIYFHKV